MMTRGNQRQGQCIDEEQPDTEQGDFNKSENDQEIKINIWIF